MNIRVPSTISRRSVFPGSAPGRARRRAGRGEERPDRRAPGEQAACPKQRSPLSPARGDDAVERVAVDLIGPEVAPTAGGRVDGVGHRVGDALHRLDLAAAGDAACARLERQVLSAILRHGPHLQRT
jgi:hypothetical protein